jgi:hypothetical protein
MNGTIAEFVNNKKFPLRDPNETLNKQIGFSKYMHRFDHPNIETNELTINQSNQIHDISKASNTMMKYANMSPDMLE